MSDSNSLERIALRYIPNGVARHVRMPLIEGEGPRPSGLQGLSVLIVEDGWQVANALRLSLGKMGMVVAGPVATTEVARRLAAECSPDLAVVDVNLRGEMAYELMDWLHDRGTRVIVISGYENLPRSLEKFAAVLHKPFTATALQATLRRVLNRDQTR